MICFFLDYVKLKIMTCALNFSATVDRVPWALRSVIYALHSPAFEHAICNACPNADGSIDGVVIDHPINGRQRKSAPMT